MYVRWLIIFYICVADPVYDPNVARPTEIQTKEKIFQWQCECFYFLQPEELVHSSFMWCIHLNTESAWLNQVIKTNNKMLGYNLMRKNVIFNI